jgi:hypothetical protein
MRLAGSPEIFEALKTHFVSDDVPPQAAGHLAAEVMTHGESADTRIDQFFDYFARFRDQGFSEDAAQHLAIEAMEGREQEPRRTLRFAGVHGGD